MVDRWRDEDRYSRGYGRGGYGGDFSPAYGEDEERYRGGRYAGYGRDYERGYGREFGPDTEPSGYGYYGRDYGDYRRGYGGYYGYGRDYDYGRYAPGYDYGRYAPGEPGFRGERYRGAWYGAPRWWGYGREGLSPAEERGLWDRTGDEVRSWFGDEAAERRRRMDQFRGRGPKGYTRSDERIREDICDRLTDDPLVDASEVKIGVSNGEVTLSGTVDSRLEKRRAEDCAEDVSGVKNVHNELRVEQGTAATTAGATGARTTGTTETARTRTMAKT